MIAHVSGVPVEELLLWALPGGTAVLIARACLTLLLAKRPHIINHHED